MILFIFEGTKREPRLFKTLEYLFFPKNCEHIVCSYGNNIYNLYKRMSETDFDEDIVAILMEKYREEGVGSFAGIENCNRSKELASEFSFYKDLDFISFWIQKRTGTLKIPPEVQVKNIKANWKHLVKQNSEKAYSMMEGNLLPCQKGSVHSQKSIFEAQLSGFVNNDNSIAVLNAMPLFLEDYFGCKIHNPN